MLWVQCLVLWGLWLGSHLPHLWWNLLRSLQILQILRKQCSCPSQTCTTLWVQCRSRHSEPRLRRVSSSRLCRSLWSTNPDHYLLPEGQMRAMLILDGIAGARVRQESRSRCVLPRMSGISPGSARNNLRRKKTSFAITYTAWFSMTPSSPGSARQCSLYFDMWVSIFLDVFSLVRNAHRIHPLLDGMTGFASRKMSASWHSTSIWKWVHVYSVCSVSTKRFTCVSSKVSNQKTWSKNNPWQQRSNLI